MHLRSVIVALAFACVTFVCFVEFNKIRTLVTDVRNEIVTKATNEVVANEISHSRRLSSDSDASVAQNPFMNQICSDMIQDSNLEVTVNDFSVIIVARNEKKKELLNTVSPRASFIFVL